MVNKKLWKKEVGSFSVKYLKYLFLKYRKDHIPELEDSFRKRRHEEDEFDEKGNLKNYISKNTEKETKVIEVDDTSLNRVRQYQSQLRSQIDKYDAEGEEDFNKEVKSLSEPSLGNYSSQTRRLRNANSLPVRLLNYKPDSEDIDYFVSQNSVKEAPQRRSRRSRSRSTIENIDTEDMFDGDNYDLSLIDDSYLDSLVDEDFFKEETNNKLSSKSKEEEDDDDDMDDFLNKI